MANAPHCPVSYRTVLEALYCTDSARRTNVLFTFSRWTNKVSCIRVAS